MEPITRRVFLERSGRAMLGAAGDLGGLPSSATSTRISRRAVSPVL